MVVFARFTAVICAVAVLVDSHAVQLAEMVEPQLSPRAEFYGGYALSATTCPADTTSCGDSSQHGCCTNGQNCITYGYEAFCCPDKQNCRSQVEALPICADTSWTLFKYSSNYFCCQSSQVGVAASGAGVCANSDVSVPFSKLATTVTQIGGATDAPTSAGSKVTAKSTSKTTSRATGSASTDASSSGASPSSSSSSTNLPTGAIIGIAVGGVIAIGLIALASWFCYRRGQRRAMQRQQPVPAPGTVPAYSAAPPPQPPAEYKSPVIAPQAPMMPVQRYDHDHYTYEIDSRIGSGGRPELGT